MRGDETRKIKIRPPGTNSASNRTLAVPEATSVTRPVIPQATYAASIYPRLIAGGGAEARAMRRLVNNPNVVMLAIDKDQHEQNRPAHPLKHNTRRSPTQVCIRNAAVDVSTLLI